MGRGDLTNAGWDWLESFLPSGGGGGRWSDHRRVINGVLYRVRTGVQWRDLPERFGPWETVYKRHRRWSADGTWTMLLSRIQEAEDAAGRIDWDVSVDSTAVRAHQHATSTRRRAEGTGGRSPSKGDRRGDEPGRSGVEKTDGPVGGSGQIGECLGRSRGGFTTKFHLAADGRCRPPALVLTPGHYGDGPQLERVLGQVSVPRIGVGRPRTRPDHVLADKAYTSRRNRRYLRRRGIQHTIPERLDQQRHRKNRGSRGGRPAGFDSERYKKRNTVERTINRLKGFRAVATRYEERGDIYLGTVTLAALVIWLRT
ncbi:IS5 family transposase [Streptomyces sp. ME02-7008A-1]|uniref:IS5 family transposase n=1 Tax=Streptomyces sp. ME02-7008A TaxID=3028679 RepID=UPI0029B2C8DE|nr:MULTISPECIES: IS5 family transposase [unclassified Streptomyces]MDX3186220.1 IS5 family transposase [Streptomyces sp. ME02-7008A-1]MDX3307331.1 IS5 family transposase [Streptomyces sp. ME02-7008A]